MEKLFKFISIIYVSNVSFIDNGLENFEYKFCLPFDGKFPKF